MTSPIVEVKLSPSGKRLGPIQIGPGSAGRKWRAHGPNSTAVVAGSVVPITDLDAISVDLQPGYLYEIDLYTTMQVVNSTDTTNGYRAVYRLRDKATGVFGSWTNFPTTRHVFPGNPAKAYECRQFPDAAFDVAVTAVADQIGIGVQGSAAAGTTTTCLFFGCHIVISEYLP
jgi:hypothetical protein